MRSSMREEKYQWNFCCSFFGRDFQLFIGLLSSYNPVVLVRLCKHLANSVLFRVIPGDKNFFLHDNIFLAQFIQISWTDSKVSTKTNVFLAIETSEFCWNRYFSRNLRETETAASISWVWPNSARILSKGWGNAKLSNLFFLQSSFLRRYLVSARGSLKDLGLFTGVDNLTHININTGTRRLNWDGERLLRIEGRVK